MLIPCGGCRRHVRSSEPACPFCGAAIEAAPARSSLAGRFSRAAVFAGLASCASSPPVQHAPPPPPPPDDRRVQEPPPPPPDDVVEAPPPDEQNYAKPPDDTTKAAVAPGGIEGTVRDHHGRPIPGFAVDLGGQSVVTDARGRYRFANLPPGSHHLLVRTSNNPRHGPMHHLVEVKSGKVARADIKLPAPVVDRGPCCKPYGAPPARRRVV